MSHRKFRMFSSQNIKVATTFLVLVTLVLILPKAPIDPWNLIGPKKMALMVLALVLIQVMGTWLYHFAGTKSGAVMTGFLGGIISSTATTASIARQSVNSPSKENSVEILTYLSATIAMLVEAAVLVIIGTSEFHMTLLLIFIGPGVCLCALIFFKIKKLPSQKLEIAQAPFRLLPILKLAGFIILVLILSKVLQLHFGQNGLYLLTFLVSLFEIHGSVITNIQLHDLGTIDILTLGHLLTISVFSSVISKLFLVFALGKTSFKIAIVKRTIIILISAAISWGLFFAFNRVVVQ